MTVQDRLRLLRGSLSYQQFADRMKYNANSVRRYELGLARVPLDYVEAVCRELHISADWLVFGVEVDLGMKAHEAAAKGNGRLRRADERAAAPKGDGAAFLKSVESRRYTLIDGEKVRIVCVPVLTHVPAGAPREMLDATPVGFGLDGEAWVPDPQDENAYGLIAWGDSMEPLIHHGETIIVSPRRRFDFRTGVAVVRIFGDEVCVKYVRMREPALDLISANPRYPRKTFDRNDVELLGPVVQVIRGEGREN